MTPPTNRHRWIHPSVKLLAGDADPIQSILRKAAGVALQAMQDGWSGPPFDPFALAELLHIPVSPNSDVVDARTVPVSKGKVRIEYNPNRSRARIRYSVAHEIAHTLFPDCSEQVRNRAAREELAGDEWELEMLCNLGAAELLMPTGSLVDVQDRDLSLTDILELRQKFGVSTESVLLRLARISTRPVVSFAASCGEQSHGRYVIDYSLGSRAADPVFLGGVGLPKDSVVGACTAIGYRASADEVWPRLGQVRVECLGVSPYPNSVHPRVVGIVKPFRSERREPGGIQFVTGDATEPRPGKARLLAHIVNDATPNWGKGFGRVVQHKWPRVHDQFRKAWASSHGQRLGDVVFSDADPDLTVCQMICQHGYGPSERPRLRYSALRDCLDKLRDRALAGRSDVHMPRIGTGEAGGSWHLVQALIDEELCGAGVKVTVYDLPGRSGPKTAQIGLFDQRA